MAGPALRFDQNPEDQSSLCVGVATHAAGEQSIQAARQQGDCLPRVAVTRFYLVCVALVHLRDLPVEGSLSLLTLAMGSA